MADDDQPTGPGDSNPETSDTVSKEQYDASVSRMNEATREAADTKKVVAELQAQVAEISNPKEDPFSEEALESFREDPAKLAFLLKDQDQLVRGQFASLIETMQNDFASQLSSVLPENQGYAEEINGLRERLGGGFSDEQLLKVAKASSKKRPPGRPTGGGSSQADETNGEPDIRETQLFKDIFGKTLDNLDKKKEALNK